MRRPLDIGNWERADHFHFFRKFEEPFFGVCIEADCTAAYTLCKKNDYSFFLFYLHAALSAANETEPFRYRIEEEKVWIYEQVNASPTINRPNGSFGFGYMDYEKDFLTFQVNAKQEMERVRAGVGLVPAVSGENVIHFSSLPWLRFTSISHARSFSFADSIPKISFGKMMESNGRMTMPVSIHVHHALMDGLQVSNFVDLFQEKMTIIP